MPLGEVLVTGAGGFIGQHTAALLQHYAEVSTFRHAHWWECTETPDYVVHLAAAPPYDEWRTFRDNTDFTHMLCAQLPDWKPEGVVVASTIDVYGKPQHAPMAEDHPVQPSGMHAISKYTCERMLQTTCDMLGIPLTILRFTQVYGPGDTSTKAIPNFMRCIRAAQPPHLYGDGRAVRDYLYVQDAAQAVLRALLTKGGGVYNIGTGEGFAIRDVLSIVLALSGSNLKPQHLDVGREATESVYDVRKARQQLGFAAQTPLEKGLAETWRQFV